MCGINRPSHYIRVSSGMKADIKIWLSFLENFNATCSFGKNIWLSNSQINLFTDSAGNPDLGCGVFFAGHWTYYQLSDHWHKPDIMAYITFLELVPIVLFIFLFKQDLSNKQILFHTDNKALVCILNKRSSKSRRVMGLIRACHDISWSLF